MRRGWSLPLRVWLAIALAGVVASPLAAWLGLVVAVAGPDKSRPTPWERRFYTQLDGVVRLIEARAGDWADPAFQRDLAARLDEAALAAVLMGPDGRVLFTRGPVLESGFPHWIRDAGEGAVPGSPPLRLHGDEYYAGALRDGAGRLLGFYLLSRYGPDPLLDWVLAAIAGGLTLASAAVVWWVGRSLRDPIRALARAAYRVQEGDLDFDLPRGPVRELNDLAGAFAAMRDGLRESIFRQAAAEQERRLWIAALAHDLRNPLAAVRGYVEGLRDGVARSPEQAARYIAVLERKTQDLERLVESLFALARSDYLGQGPCRERICLAELLTGAVEGMQPRAAARGVRLEMEKGPDPCPLEADRLMLSRIADNLLDNALRHTPPGGRVKVGWERDGDRCRFWVEDTGPGIPPADLDRIFDPLYRSPGGQRGGGAGLGLAIARRLAEAHGGRITAAGSGGARFTVELPVGAAATLAPHRWP